MKSIAVSRKSSFAKRKRNQLIFYICLIALPMIQFAIFYIGVNINSILLAFQGYEVQKGYYWTGFDNFKQIFYDFKTIPYLKSSIKNSLILYVVTLCSMVLSMLFSYYIYRKRTCAGFFKIILFLPNIISGLILAIMYKYLVENAPYALGYTIGGLLSNEKTAFPTILVFNVLTSFGTQSLLFSGAMEGITDSVIDASKIDGCSPMQEFIHIIIPMIWPTISTFFVIGIAGIFTNQMCLYSFFGTKAEYQYYTFGYYLYKSIQTASIGEYPYLAAMGLVLTFVAVPLTYLVKWATEKFGPKQ